MTRKKAARSETGDFVAFLVKLALFILILRSFIVSPFNIPSESMQPRLVVGDYLLVAKWPYGFSQYSLPFSAPLIPGRVLPHSPEPGDVVVFKAPPNAHEDYIKRVIGLSGDIIQVTDGVVSINGTPVERKRIDDFKLPLSANSPCYRPEFESVIQEGGAICRYPQFQETLPNGVTYRILDVDQNSEGDNTQAFVVPEGHMFLMGDNRDRSADSRFPAQEGQAIGMVPEENLVGKALVSVFSTDGSAEWIKPWTWFTAARWDRIGERF
ncbi:MAG: signal peptidase I [Sphingomonadales bacterium]|nr:signal peptidase I [Sphingomonadales bacterium]PIX66935.1 MAG: signal peptidase I [Sphingomonadales bacterium CG_4_10_14_3_um_filter_58_15]NCO48559.1 signal peptidase I [Sphingomonadales bacterium]NCO99854.1 signal peptidase I [Sphingomonadales bacterium]NCP26504.1 signal peptidase I [Sphingomonadales bacterium]